MKKLLSIFAIGGGLLGSTLPTVTACKSTATKFDLTNVRTFNIDVTSNNQHQLQIDIENAYQKITQSIISGYNAFGFKEKTVISSKDFKYGLDTDSTHSWAVAVMQADKTTMMAQPTTGNNNRNIFTSTPTVAANKVLLPDNALEVKIKTTNKNVKATSAIAHAYLNKFAYTGANINQGTEIYSATTISATNLRKAIDITSITHLSESHLEPISAWTGPFKQITGTQKTQISKMVIDALNKQLKTETTDLNKWGVVDLKTLATEEINFADVQPTIYKIHNNDVSEISGQTRPEAGDEIYARILNLGLSSYLGVQNSYLYLKIGTAT